MFFLPVIVLDAGCDCNTVLENKGLESAGHRRSLPDRRLNTDCFADCIGGGSQSVSRSACRRRNSPRGFAENKNEKLLQYCFQFLK